MQGRIILKCNLSLVLSVLSLTLSFFLPPSIKYQFRQCTYIYFIFLLKLLAKIRLCISKSYKKSANLCWNKRPRNYQHFHSDKAITANAAWQADHLCCTTSQCTLTTLTQNLTLDSSTSLRASPCTQQSLLLWYNCAIKQWCAGKGYSWPSSVPWWTLSGSCENSSGSMNEGPR